MVEKDNLHLEAALTIWLFEEINRQGLKYTKVEQESGLSTDHYGKKFRDLWNGKRKWTVIDLVHLSQYFKIDVSVIVAIAELLIKSRPDDIQRKISGEMEKPNLLSRN